MIKSYFKILLLSLLVYCSYQYTSKCDGTQASTLSECLELLLPEEKDSDFHCCFTQAKKNGVKNSQCDLISDSDYNSIKHYIGDYEDHGYSEVSVDCKSYFLQLSLLYLLLFLL